MNKTVSQEKSVDTHATYRKHFKIASQPILNIVGENIIQFIIDIQRFNCQTWRERKLVRYIQNICRGRVLLTYSTTELEYKL